MEIKPKYCPFCKSENLVKSYENAVDYHVIGDTFRCKDCKCGFSHLMESSDDWKIDE